MNKHHIWYPRRSYHGSIEKNFRNYYGFVIPTEQRNHNLLHSQLRDGSPKPTRQEMGDCIDFVEDWLVSDELTATRAAAEFFRLQDREKISDHLLRQVGILSLDLYGT